MTQDELIELLNAHEWRDVEFKEARRAAPKNAYETVSAFANTKGGHLVFGVKKSGQEMEVVGVLDVDKVQNDFLTTLRQPDKISVVVNVRGGTAQVRRLGSAYLLRARSASFAQARLPEWGYSPLVRSQRRKRCSLLGQRAGSISHGRGDGTI